MLICPHLCWQQFPALVLLPCSLASGHLHDVSISQVLPCIHLSLQSLDYICIVGLPPVDKESPGADKPCISSLSLLSYRFLFLFHLSCSIVHLGAMLVIFSFSGYLFCGLIFYSSFKCTLEYGKKNSVDLRTWLSLSAEIVAEFMPHNGMFCGMINILFLILCLFLKLQLVESSVWMSLANQSFPAYIYLDSLILVQWCYLLLLSMPAVCMELKEKFSSTDINWRIHTNCEPSQDSADMLRC